MLTNRLQALVLAAGKSKRFNTGRSKQLSLICGRPMIIHVLSTLKTLGVDITVIIGNDAPLIEKEVQSIYDDISFAYQHEQHGTGHAIACSRETWNADTLLILNGDMPLQTASLIERLYSQHREKNADLSFMSSFVLDPRGYGRVISTDGKIEIIEEKECSREQQEVNKINAGVYIVTRAFLEEALDHLKPSARTGEYYITDIVKYATLTNREVSELTVPYDLVRNVNTLEELWQVEHIKRSELIKHWMMQGVRFALPQTVHIDCDVTIESGTHIHAGVQLRGKTHIGKESVIDAFSIIENSTVGDFVTIHPHSILNQSTVKNHAIVGPFAHIREGATINPHAQVGNFVEIKKSVLGEESKVKHLSYVGDAAIGKNVNIGAGSIICNFDGVHKHETIIEDNAFVGSNSTLVAPIKVSKNSFIAAGSTITHSVEENDLAIARARQENKKGYAAKILKKEINKKKQSTDSQPRNEKKTFIGAYKSYVPSKEML